MTQYLVTWMGHVTNSFAGRDDGYPEQKMALINESHVWEYASRAQAVFYKIARCDVSALVAQQKLDKQTQKRQAEIDKQAAYAKLTPRERELLSLTPINWKKK